MCLLADAGWYRVAVELLSQQQRVLLCCSPQLMQSRTSASYR
jgi:hypothetical protein